jgi:hypothetical protein
MNMKKAITILVVIAAMASSCGTTKQQTKMGSKETRISQQSENDNKWEWLKDIKTVSLSCRVNTNFDNFGNLLLLTDEQVRQLKLVTKIDVYEGSSQIGGSGFLLNYKLNLSDNFYALVVSYQLSEMELFTSIITYDKEYNIIDLLMIAYDEIAESWFRTESIIYKDHIIVENSGPVMNEETGYPSDEYQTKKVNYKIEKNGTFTKQKK